MHLDAPLRQLLGNDAGGTHLLESDLGMGMQIPADRGEFVGKAFDTFDIGHVVICSRKVRVILLQVKTKRHWA